MSMNNELKANTNVNAKNEILSLGSFDKLNLQSQINKDGLEFKLAVDELLSDFDSLFTTLTEVSVAS